MSQKPICKQIVQMMKKIQQAVLVDLELALPPAPRVLFPDEDELSRS